MSIYVMTAGKVSVKSENNIHQKYQLKRCRKLYKMYKNHLWNNCVNVQKNVKIGKRRESIMLNSRQEDILQFLLEENFAKVEVLANRFEVSIETIRRDLLRLENESYIKRVHGGAKIDNLRAKEKQYEDRTQRNFSEKKAIAREAAKFIHNGDTIVMNTGTSTLELAKLLQDRENLTVITNSVDVACVIVENEANKVYMPGGLLRKCGRGTSGEMCCEFLSRFQVDKAILSVGGISEKSGITEYHVDESAVVRKMVEIGSKVMVLCDYSKFNEVALNKICEYKDIDYIFTDWHTPVREILKCKERGIRVYVGQK